MKTTLLTFAAATALVAGAAAAQPYGNGYGYYEGHRWGMDAASFDQREAMLQTRIERGIDTGQLTRREAWQARSALRDIERIEYRYRLDGRISPWEARDLDRRLDQVAMQIRFDRHDDERTYGYNTYRPY